MIAPPSTLSEYYILKESSFIMKKNFVTCSLMGRTGNQFFQCASVISTAKRHDLDWYIPAQTESPDTWEFYFKDKFPTLTPDMAKTINHAYIEPDEYRFVPIPKLEGNFKIHGFWQSEKHFKFARPEIEEAFSFLYEGDRIKDTVSLHVRRGDYVTYYDAFPPVTPQYLSSAIKYFSTLGFKKFLVFSDDIEWCKNHFADYTEKVTFGYSEGLAPIDDLKRMMCCEHHIISNSTFSWVAAWMNKNPDKIVVSPSKHNWFGPAAVLSADHIIPDEWIQIRY